MIWNMEIDSHGRYASTREKVLVPQFIPWRPFCHQAHVVSQFVLHCLAALAMATAKVLWS